MVRKMHNCDNIKVDVLFILNVFVFLLFIYSFILFYFFLHPTNQPKNIQNLN